MTIIIAGIIVFAIIFAFHLGKESGRVDRLLEASRLRNECEQLRRELDDMSDAMSDCRCGHDSTPLSYREFEAWRGIVEREQ